MRISQFKFGNTVLYAAPDGTVAKGLVYSFSSRTRSLAEWMFACSCALFIFFLAATSGKAYAMRLAVSTGLDDAPIFENLFKSGQAAAVLPLANPQAIFGNEAVQEPARFNASNAVLSIPAIGVSAPVVDTSADLSSINADLSRGVVRWPQGAALDEGGTAVLLGHSSSPLPLVGGKYTSVFALLDKLAEGGAVSLSDGAKILNYRVTGRVIVDRANFDDGSQLAGAEDRLILVSCWPVGTSWKRIAVTAERVGN